MTTYTRALADFAVSASMDDLPASAVEATRRLIVDTLGCAVGGRDVPSSQIVTRLKVASGGSPAATVMVGGERLDLLNAVYLNSHYANALDAEETIRHSGHLAAATVPPALAVAESLGSSGEDFFVAVAVGFDVAARVALSLRTLDTTADGRVVISPVAGSSWAAFAATVATGRLCGLDSNRMAAALGITVASAPMPIAGRWGVQASPRPMTKYGLYGAIAEAGVVGALLAREGMDGYDDILDGDHGFWRMNGSRRCDWESLTDGLGTTWLVEETSYKLFPACQWAMPALELFFRILDDNGLRADEVEAVEALVPQAAITKHMADREVRTIVDGEFSIPHLLALAARGGPPGPVWHTEQMLRDPGLAEFSGRVSVAVWDQAEPILSDLMATQGHAHLIPTRLTVTAHGRDFSAVSNTSDADQWDSIVARTDTAIHEKFGRFCAPYLSPTAIARALAVTASIEQADTMEELVATLVSV